MTPTKVERLGANIAALPPMALAATYVLLDVPGAGLLCMHLTASAGLILMLFAARPTWGTQTIGHAGLRAFVNRKTLVATTLAALSYFALAAIRAWLAFDPVHFGLCVGLGVGVVLAAIRFTSWVAEGYRDALEVDPHKRDHRWIVPMTIIMIGLPDLIRPLGTIDAMTVMRLWATAFVAIGYATLPERLWMTQRAPLRPGRFFAHHPLRHGAGLYVVAAVVLTSAGVGADWSWSTAMFHGLLVLMSAVGILRFAHDPSIDPEPQPF